MEIVTDVVHSCGHVEAHQVHLDQVHLEDLIEDDPGVDESGFRGRQMLEAITAGGGEFLAAAHQYAVKRWARKPCSRCAESMS